MFYHFQFCFSQFYFSFVNLYIFMKRYSLFCMQHNHKNIRGLWGVSFPLFDEIVEIIGKDKATDKIVKTYVDAINNMEREMKDDAINLDSNGEYGGWCN